MRFGGLTRAPRRVLILFLTVTLIPVAALGWLSWSLLQQDRELEVQRLRDRLDRAAELVVSNLARRLAETAERFDVQRDLPDEAVIVEFSPRGIEAKPRLIYYPEMPVTANLHEEAFAEGDALEYREMNYPAAIGVFRDLSRSQDSGMRAAALARLAANYKKSGQLENALSVYGELEKLGPLSFGDGTPADLFARQAQCSILKEMGRQSALLPLAQALNADFEKGRWILDRGSHGLYFEEARRIFPPEAQPRAPSPDSIALAEGVQWLWSEWKETRRDQSVDARWRSLWAGDRPILTVWRISSGKLTALVAGAPYVESQWGNVWKDEGVNVVLSDAEGHKVFGQPTPPGTLTVVRKAADTSLPWTIRISRANPGADSAEFLQRRRLLWAGLGLMTLLTLLGGYLTMRAAAREFAVTRLQSDFVSAVSHEFRTPLTALRHMTELLSNDAVLSDDRRRDYYSVMARETERLHRLVEGLLAFGRMEARGSEYALETIDPVELTQSAVADFHTASHRVELTTNGLLPRTTAIRANREALSRAIRNLVENAVKYSPNSSVVDVHLARQGNQLAIRIHDDGVGIPAEEQKVIFDKFVRGSASKALNVPGTGIGLAMTQHIVHAHGGAILLESSAGRGTTFTIQLPVTDS